MQKQPGVPVSAQLVEQQPVKAPLTSHSPTRSSQVVKIAQPLPAHAAEQDTLEPLEETYLLAHKQRDVVTRQEMATGVDSQPESPLKLVGAGKYQTIGDQDLPTMTGPASPHRDDAKTNMTANRMTLASQPSNTELFSEERTSRPKPRRPPKSAAETRGSVPTHSNFSYLKKSDRGPDVDATTENQGRFSPTEMFGDVERQMTEANRRSR